MSDYMPLRHFIDYFPTLPGFGDIVLEHNDNVYIQVVDANGIVRGFEEVDVEESIHLGTVPNDVGPAIVGQQAWYGFRGRGGDVIIRQRESMRVYLYQTFGDYSDMAFLSYEIADFLEDEEKRSACADMIMRKKDLFDLSSRLESEFDLSSRLESEFDLSSRLEREHVSLGAPVVSLMQEASPETSLHLRSALQSFGPVEQSIQQLAYQMWKNSFWNTQCALDFWLAAEKHVLVMTVAAMCRPTSPTKEANTLAPVLSILSEATHLQLIKRIAHSIWEQTGRQYGLALDNWLAAEKQVLAVSVAVVESSSDAQQAIPRLLRGVNNLDPAMVLEPIRSLAEAMWEQAGRQPGHPLDFWVAAERDVLSLTVAAIRQAPLGTEPAEVIAQTFTAFSPIRLLDMINDRARSLWQEFGRQTSRTVDYWLTAERQLLLSIADGKESIPVRRAA